MIGRLKGTVAALTEESTLIDVGGVGYDVLGHGRFLTGLSVGEEVMISIETVVREDFIRLYGFASESERHAFRVLQSVQGVGAKHALALLQVLPPTDLYDAIAAEDLTAISRAHGVGKRLAQRVATELQSKLGSLAAGVSGGTLKVEARQAVAEAGAGGSALNGAKAEAISALANLGYDGVDARKAVARAAQSAGGDAGVEALIKGALKELAPA